MLKTPGWESTSVLQTHNPNVEMSEGHEAEGSPAKNFSSSCRNGSVSNVSRIVDIGAHVGIRQVAIVPIAAGVANDKHAAIFLVRVVFVADQQHAVSVEDLFGGTHLENV